MINFTRELQKRSGGICELCGSSDELVSYQVPSSPKDSLETQLLVCVTCRDQMANISTAEEMHWRCLKDSIWSEVPAVKVISWRMLNKLTNIDWATDLLEIAYLEDDTLEWAKASGDGQDPNGQVQHLDCFGAILQSGDNVVLTKTLEIKGATFNAKVGTVVRKIHLVADNADQIEGRVNGYMIVILTKYVKKITS